MRATGFTAVVAASCILGACAGGPRGAAAPAPAARPPGDAARGAAIVASRSQGLCTLCHAVPGVPAVLSGNLGPDLAGAGARFTPDELRERLVAPERFNRDTIMPSVRRTEGLLRVAAQRRGRPLLDEQQIEDVVAYLTTLR